MKMALTVTDVANHLRYDDGTYDDAQIEFDLAVGTEAVKNHIKDKFDAENVVHQKAILLLCGYYDSYRNAEKDMPTNNSFLPDPVLALLNPYYVPLAQ